MEPTNRPRCKHCGEAPESATTTNSETIISDSCYGCRNRYEMAFQAISRAVSDLDYAVTLLQYTIEDVDGCLLAAGVGQIATGASGVKTLVGASR